MIRSLKKGLGLFSRRPRGGQRLIVDKRETADALVRSCQSLAAGAEVEIRLDALEEAFGNSMIHAQNRLRERLDDAYGETFKMVASEGRGVLTVQRRLDQKPRVGLRPASKSRDRSS